MADDLEQRHPAPPDQDPAQVVSILSAIPGVHVTPSTRIPTKH